MKAIVLTRGRIATVDDEDFDRCNRFKWQIHVNRRARHLGSFVVEEDAARAYDTAARELFGEFASPNFP